MPKMQPFAPHGSFQPNRARPLCPKCASPSSRVGSDVFAFRCQSCGTQFDGDGIVMIRGVLQRAPGAFYRPAPGDEQRVDFAAAT
jgi:tRNA(Ile2) C34 agmatinyltransferase TiaS